MIFIGGCLGVDSTPYPLTKSYKILVRLDPEASVDDVLKLLGLKFKRTVTCYLGTSDRFRALLRRVGSFDEFMDELLTIFTERIQIGECCARKIKTNWFNELVY